MFAYPSFQKKRRNHKNSPILQYLHFKNYYTHVIHIYTDNTTENLQSLLLIRSCFSEIIGLYCTLAYNYPELRANISRDMGVGRIFSRRGPIVDFSIGSQKGFSRGAKKWWNFISFLETKKTTFFCKICNDFLRHKHLDATMRSSAWAQ